MQTFLPYADFQASCVALDDRRLGKQRVETFQILRALTWPDYAWKNHPAVRMWRGFVPALVAYGLANCAEWVRRGNADTVEASLLVFSGGTRPDQPGLARRGQLPPWLGLPPLHLSHRSALVRKDPEFYRPLFGEIPDDLPYLWPPDAFPRWPARRSASGTGIGGALLALGYDAPRPGQTDAVTAVLEGADVLGCFAPRAGATSTGLLAGLAQPGGRTTLWLSVHAGGGGELPPGGLTPPPPRVRELKADADADEAGSDEAADENAGEENAAPARSGPVARPPSPVEVLAMAAEADAEPDFRFHRPADLEHAAVRAEVLADPPALVVVDLGPAGAHGPVPDHGEAVRRIRADAQAARSDDAPVPLLVVGGEADQSARARLIDAYALHQPASVGGGFDPAALRLGVVRVPDENRRRAALASLIAAGPKTGLVVGGPVEATRRLAKGLADRGARVAPLLPAGRRSSTEAAVAQWRRGGLRALVLPGDLPVPAERLGRKDAQLVLVAGLPGNRRRLLQLLHDVPNRSGAAVPALLVLTDDEIRTADALDPGLPALLAGDGCRRAALLDVVGEPVAVPCGRCDVCLQVPASELLGGVQRADGGTLGDAVSATR